MKKELTEKQKEFLEQCCDLLDKKYSRENSRRMIYGGRINSKGEIVALGLPGNKIIEKKDMEEKA